MTALTVLGICFTVLGAVILLATDATHTVFGFKPWMSSLFAAGFVLVGVLALCSPGGTT